MYLVMLAILVCLMVAATNADCLDAGSQAAPHERLFESEPWLSDLSSWVGEVDTRTVAGPLAELRRHVDLGCYGVGNGLVFGAVGMKHPLNRLFNLCDYQRAHDVCLGEESAQIASEGRDIELPVQRVARVRGTGILVTEITNETFCVRTVDFAVPAEPVLCRLIEVELRAESECRNRTHRGLLRKGEIGDFT